MQGWFKQLRFKKTQTNQKQQTMKSSNGQHSWKKIHVFHTDIADLSDLTSIFSLSAPDVMHWVMGLGQYAGLCDVWPGLPSSGICSASLRGLLQQGALTLLMRVYVLIPCLFFIYAVWQAMQCLYTAGQKTPMKQPQDNTPEHKDSQLWLALLTNHFIVLCCRLANWHYDLFPHLQRQITILVYAHPYNGSYCCFKKHITMSVKFHVFCFC